MPLHTEPAIQILALIAITATVLLILYIIHKLTPMRSMAEDEFAQLPMDAYCTLKEIAERLRQTGTIALAKADVYEHHAENLRRNHLRDMHARGATLRNRDSDGSRTRERHDSEGGPELRATKQSELLGAPGKATFEHEYLTKPVDPKKETATEVMHRLQQERRQRKPTFCIHCEKPIDHNDIVRDSRDGRLIHDKCFVPWAMEQQIIPNSQRNSP